MNTNYADYVITSKAIYTGLQERPEEAAVAVRENKIIAVCSHAEMEKFIGPHTKRFDYGDKMVMPGFHDFHLHIMFGSLAMESVNLFEARSEKEAVELVKNYASAIPREEWIIGVQWDSSYWDKKDFPTRHSLDEAFPDRPVMLIHAEGHYVWSNSKALELAGITASTKDPSFGSIERDEQGEPTGILIEQAVEYMARVAYNFSYEKKKSLFESFLKLTAQYGVTSVNDLYGTEINEHLQDFTMLKEFEESNKLTTRVHLYPALNGNLAHAKELRNKYQSKKLSVSGLKQFIDGVITSYTALLLEPYADKPDTCGELAFNQETLNKWVIEADKEGFSVRFHAIGEGAIRMALDAFEAAVKENGRLDSRHSVEHVEVIHPNDIHRFKELGVIVSMQPNHFVLSERGVYTSRIGKEREKYVFNINTLKNTGATLAFGTDFPIDFINPLKQIYTAITRIDSSGKDVWNPEERITLSEALNAYTSGPAYGTFREELLGTLEPGKLADLVVLDRNIFSVRAEELLDTKVVLTMCDGEIVYQQD